MFFQQAEGVVSVCGFLHTKTRNRECGSKHAAQVVVVFHEQNDLSLVMRGGWCAIPWPTLFGTVRSQCHSETER